MNTKNPQAAVPQLLYWNDKTKHIIIPTQMQIWHYPRTPMVYNLEVCGVD